MKPITYEMLDNAAASFEDPMRPEFDEAVVEEGFDREGITKFCWEISRMAMSACIRGEARPSSAFAAAVATGLRIGLKLGRAEALEGRVT